MNDWIDDAAEAIASSPACCDISSASADAIAEVIRRHSPSNLQKWIDASTGQECSPGEPGSIEIRTAGAGWRWHDFDFHEWRTSNGPTWYRVTDRPRKEQP